LKFNGIFKNYIIKLLIITATDQFNKAEEVVPK
jgi:hypothetical protein